MSREPFNQDFGSCEESYKQGMVSTTSIQRTVLALYERILLLLKKAIESVSNLPLVRRYLVQVQQILTHLLQLFLEHVGFQSLYLSHERIAQQLSDIFRQESAQFDLLRGCYQRIESYRDELCQQLNIRKRFPNEAVARLNIRRQPELPG